MRLFTAAIATETNTFASLPTGRRAYQELCLYRGGDYGGPPRWAAVVLAHWRAMAARRGDTVVESLCANAAPAGPTVASVYEEFRETVLADLRAAMPVDAILLRLHGAMVADGYDDCEGDLLTHLRAAAPGVTIGVELDLHCHLTQAMLDHSDIIVMYKEYPHTDTVDRATELYGLTEAAVAGRIRPRMAMFDCRMIGSFPTTGGPMRDLVSRCKALEGKDGILSVSIGHGFPWGDVADMGARTLVVADGDAAKAASLAEQLGRDFHAIRAAAMVPYIPLPEAIAQAAAWRGPGPMILADVADNPGGGTASDATFMLQALLDAGIENAALGLIWDQVAVELAFNAGIGARLAMRIGGKLGPMSGPPLDLSVTVAALAENVSIAHHGFGSTRLGDVAALRVGGVTIVCTTLRAQCLSLDCFTCVGIDPARLNVAVVKSIHHFHAAFAPIAGKILHVAAPGGLTPDFAALPYRKANRHQWPLVAEPFGGG